MILRKVIESESIARLLMVLPLILSSLACGGVSPTATPGTGSGAPGVANQSGSPVSEVKGELVVFAAASLSEAFHELAQAFQQQHSGVKITFNFASSSALRTQLSQGAKADVFASADKENMDRAVAEGLIAGQPRVFVRNVPVIAVSVQSKVEIHSLADLAKPGVKLVFAIPGVPIGAYTQKILEKASQDPAYGSDFAQRVRQNVVSEEPNVKALFSKVVFGEADAAIVYRTDITADVREKVKVVEIPEAFNVTAEYYIGLPKDSPNPTAGQAFINFVLSPAGQEILAKWGFLPVR